MPFRRRPPFSELLESLTIPSDWSRMTAWAPELAALSMCPQDPEHHSEGDVATHTRMVLAALEDDDLYAAADAETRRLLTCVAALHDVGKPATTRRDVEGRWRAPGHARIGARVARRILWEAGAPPLWREAVASMVAAHMRPFHLIDQKDPRRAAIDVAEALRGPATARLLIAQATADAAGRRCGETAELADRVALASAIFDEYGVADGPWPFSTARSRARFFASSVRDPHYADIAPPRAAVTLLSGLPGVGKDHWIDRGGAGLPVISLDAVRSRLGARATGGQGAVIQAAVAEAKTHLRAGRPFIWNATNLTRALRAKPLALFRDYGAAVEIVYLETDVATLRARNSGRAAAVPEAALDKLVDRVEPPDGREAEHVRWVIDGDEIRIAG